MKIFIDTRELFFFGKIVEVVSRVDLLNDDGRRQKVIWSYRDDGGNYTWKIHQLSHGEQVIVGFSGNNIAQILTTADLEVLAGLRKNTPELDTWRRAIRMDLIAQLREEEERSEVEKKARQEEAIRQQREQEEAVQRERSMKVAAEKQRQEAREAEERAEKARQRDERKREVNSRSTRPFWNATTGERFWGTPIHKMDEMAVLVPTTHPDRTGKVFAYAVEVEDGKPKRAIKVEKRPGGGQPIVHDFDFPVTFKNPNRSAATQSSMLKAKQLSEIWLVGPKGCRKYRMLEPVQARDPDILAILQNNEAVAVNEPKDGQYPVYHMVRGNLMLHDYCKRGKNNKTNQVAAA